MSNSVQPYDSSPPASSAHGMCVCVCVCVCVYKQYV